MNSANLADTQPYIPILGKPDLGLDEWDESAYQVPIRLTVGLTKATPLVERQAKIVAVHDGDTCKIEIVNWHELEIFAPQYGRLWGYDAAEIHDPRPEILQQALAARLELQKLAMECGGLVTLRIHCPDKYGRRIVTEFVSARGVNFGEELERRGLVRKYTGQGPKPW